MGRREVVYTHIDQCTRTPCRIGDLKRMLAAPVPLVDTENMHRTDAWIRFPTVVSLSHNLTFYILHS